MDQPALQALLSSIPGVERAYFQTPPSTGMVYPCIVYKLDSDDVKHADNKVYSRIRRWQITLMDKRPDSPIESVLAELPMSRFNKHFAVDNLNHFVFTIFF